MNELKLMNIIKNKNCIYLNTHIEHFIYTENDDKYVCIVFELFAGTLFDLIKKGKYKNGLPIPVVKKIAIQILEGVCVLHNKLNMIHTDLKPENILFKGINKNYC